MRKKRNDQLNVSQLFVLNNSLGPKVVQTKSGNSFSQAVSGFAADSDENKTAWPDLTSSTKFSQYRDKKNRTNPLKENVQSKKAHVLSASYNESGLNSSDVPSFSENKRQIDDGTNSNFPSLGGRKKSKNQKSTSQFIHPDPTNGESTLVKARRFPLKGVKVKRNDPINIDIEAAIEVSKARQKKDLKRLDQKRPRVLTSTNCGNALDSANPIRKKGKVRLDKKRKLTTLRKTIERLKTLPSIERDIQGALCKKLDGVKLSKDNLEKIAKAKVHNSKFREYCKNFATRDLVSTVKEFLMAIRVFQDRMFKSNEIKARARRRYAVGFHECCKLLKANSFKVIIIATNIERNEALLKKINEVLTESMRQGVPVIFAGTCTDLSYWLFKKNRTCVIGIINYDGANEIYAKMMNFFERDKAAYEVKLSEIIEAEPMSIDEAETLRTNLLEKFGAK